MKPSRSTKLYLAHSTYMYTFTNEIIPFYKALRLHSIFNIYVCIRLQMKPSLFYVSLSLPYKHILHDMAYFHWWNNPQSVLKLSHTSTDRNIEWDQEYSNTGQKFNREKCKVFDAIRTFCNSRCWYVCPDTKMLCLKDRIPSKTTVGHTMCPFCL